MNKRFDAASVSPDQLVKLIPISRGCELDFGNDEREMARYRRGLYSINKNNAAGWRFRSMRNGSILTVWRVS